MITDGASEILCDTDVMIDYDSSSIKSRISICYSFI
jgi:hypothetical protein